MGISCLSCFVIFLCMFLIVMEEMLEVCLWFFILRIVDCIFDVFLFVEERYNLCIDFIYNEWSCSLEKLYSFCFLLNNRGKVIKFKLLKFYFCVCVDNGDMNFKVVCCEFFSVFVCIVSV